MGRPKPSRYRSYRRGLGERAHVHCRVSPETRAELERTGAPSRTAGEVLDAWARERVKLGGDFSAQDTSTPEPESAEVERQPAGKPSPGQRHAESGADEDPDARR